MLFILLADFMVLYCNCRSQQRHSSIKHTGLGFLTEISAYVNSAVNAVADLCRGWSLMRTKVGQCRGGHFWPVLCSRPLWKKRHCDAVPLCLLDCYACACTQVSILHCLWEKCKKPSSKALSDKLRNVTCNYPQRRSKSVVICRRVYACSQDEMAAN